MRIVQAFTDHPATVGESYLQHMRSALGFSLSMMLGAICCMIHAFLPFLFVKTGSSAIDDLYRRMVSQRSRRPVAAISNPPSTAAPPRDELAA